MESSVVTIKGQILVPVRIRRRLGIKKGTKVAIIEEEHGFLVRTLDKKYFEQFAGILPVKGKAAKALIEERRKDREREECVNEQMRKRINQQRLYPPEDGPELFVKSSPRSSRNRRRQFPRDNSHK